ncbi:hypothetical protein Sjap_024254 [Stephania japonica]|uniref:Uncharacterized protein n=1 Tax=Stephania japonica TaxID=461633 RepID=A0AAP0HNJ0_9MAGN
MRDEHGFSSGWSWWLKGSFGTPLKDFSSHDRSHNILYTHPNWLISEDFVDRYMRFTR